MVILWVVRLVLLKVVEVMVLVCVNVEVRVNVVFKKRNIFFIVFI